MAKNVGGVKKTTLPTPRPGGPKPVQRPFPSK